MSNKKVTRKQLDAMIVDNEDISNIDVTNVTDMFGLFEGVTSFNQNISKWETGNVTDMRYMFEEATKFNQDLSEWKVGNVTSMFAMFEGAKEFNQDLSAWNLDYRKVDLRYMFKDCDLIPHVDNCGEKKRTVYKKQIGANTLYFVSCFVGLYQTLIEAINKNYVGKARRAYISKINILRDM